LTSAAFDSESEVARTFLIHAGSLIDRIPGGHGKLFEVSWCGVKENQQGGEKIVVRRSRAGDVCIRSEMLDPEGRYLPIMPGLMTHIEAFFSEVKVLMCIISRIISIRFLSIFPKL